MLMSSHVMNACALSERRVLQSVSRIRVDEIDVMRGARVLARYSCIGKNVGASGILGSLDRHLLQGVFRLAEERDMDIITALYK